MVDIDTIVQEHGKRLFNLAYRICGDEDLAEDLFQESLIAIHEALPSFREESGSFTWAYRITTRTCLRKRKSMQGEADLRAALHRTDRAARAGYEDESEIDRIPSKDLSPEETLVHNALTAEIREKCHYFVSFSLTDEQRIPLLMRDLFDFSYKEIAYILDITEDVVRSRISRARSNLKRHFEKRCSWINPDNPCTCESRVGEALAKYPSLLNQLRLNTSRPEYNRMISRQIGKKIDSEDDIIASFPLLDPKARTSLKKIVD